MKTTLLTFVFILFTSFLFAQDKMELLPEGFKTSQVDQSSEFLIIDIPGKTQEQLYKATLVYLNGTFRNPKNVITAVESESVIVNAYTDAFGANSELKNYELWYNLNMKFKDGKIRFEPIIVDLAQTFMDQPKRTVYISSTDSSNPAEINCVWMHSKKDNNYFVFNQELKASLDTWINTIINDLKTGIEKSDW